MGKRMIIEIKHEFGTGRISEDEFPNIMLDHEVTDEEEEQALNTLITYFAQREVYNIIVDLKMRNECYGPAKEMTIEEIEEQLGHKVKIVKEKK